ncbi:hypothetical protein [Azomonas macrocytogenes]|uniref:Uncharacterized protein n=1 Tax=Azomonas macrocytogenes TaxID=69962 RepID=A0A839T908_AZOMA|nr:hypothetical protein [Azomonas macrocytogenes]MBB3104505.1 hypothetical protein [Azomonas macrocytogenes]
MAQKASGQSKVCSYEGENTTVVLRDSEQTELGIKHRTDHNGIEIKGLGTSLNTELKYSPFSGIIKLWSKWSSRQLKLDIQTTTTIEKTRWLRRFDTSQAFPLELSLDTYEQPLLGHRTPSCDCNVELLQVILPDKDKWWTLGFKAFSTLYNLEHSLQVTAKYLADRQPPLFERQPSSTYLAWLK